MKTVFKVYREGQTGIDVEYDQPIIKVGKLPSSHLNLEGDPQVSRMHAVIEADAAVEKVFVIDLGSAAGTIVNDRRINKRELAAGDRMVFGQTIVEVLQLPFAVKTEPAPIPVAAAPRGPKRMPTAGEFWGTQSGPVVKIMEGSCGPLICAETWPKGERIFVDPDTLKFVEGSENIPPEQLMRLRGLVENIEAIGRALGLWTGEGDHEKVAREILDALPLEIRGAIDDIVGLALVGEPPENQKGGPSVPLPWDTQLAACVAEIRAILVRRTTAVEDQDFAAGGDMSVHRAILDINDAISRLDGVDEVAESQCGRVLSTPVDTCVLPFEPDGKCLSIEPHDEGDIELVITDQAFEPSYDGWNIQFQAVGAPRLSHQSSDPCLEAFVKLEVVDTSMRLTAGAQSTALVRDEGDEPSRHALRPLTGSPEGNVLATFFGAASVDTGGVTEIPVAMPSNEKIVDAMRKSLAVHLDKVRDERARLKVTATAESFVGRRFRVSKEEGEAT